MKRNFSFGFVLVLVLVLLMFLCPFAVQTKEVDLMPQEEIAKAPALDPMTEAEINALLGEDPYIGETDWRGNKASTKRNYGKKKIKPSF